jgi:rhomboid family GlyGly-CTERM serine protease
VNRRWPVLTLMAAFAAVAAAAIPGSSRWLIYNRTEILSGEVWRLYTGHWVHFSSRHLICDLLPVCVSGWIAESLALPFLGWLWLLAPWLIGLALLAFEPGISECGGLSGLAVTLVIYVAITGWNARGAWRWICRAALIATMAKLACECVTGRSVFDTFDGLPVVVSTTAHVTGAACGCLLYIAARWRAPGRLNFEAACK